MVSDLNLIMNQVFAYFDKSIIISTFSNLQKIMGSPFKSSQLLRMLGELRFSGRSYSFMAAILWIIVISKNSLKDYM